MEPKFLKYIKNDKTFLRIPLEYVAKKNQLLAYNHKVWQCMDTKRDKEILEKIFRKKI